MRSQDLRSAAARIGVVRLVLWAFLAVLAARAGQLSTINPDAVDQGLRQLHTRITLPGARGLILDREQRELAISVYSPSVYVLPKLVVQQAATARALARVLLADADTIARRIAGHDGFTYVARWIEPEQAEEIRTLELPGVGIELEPRRTYPASSMAASLIGFADIDGRGVRGIEQMVDSWLQGKPRTLAVERDATGRLLSSGAVDPRLTTGGDIALTLDAGLQAQAEAALAEAVEECGAKGGLVIAVDPATGDILSLVESPGYDPNDFRNVPFARTRSRAFLDAIEPGSTFKAYLVAAALETKVIDPHTLIDTGDGFIRVRGKTIRDHHPYGVIDPGDVLQFSSNVGAVWIGRRLGSERYHAALLRFGFARSTGSGFPQESSGLLRDWRDWKPVDQATVAFGQGLNVTPIQLAMATAALANDGVLMRPRLIGARRRPKGEWESLPPQPVRQALSPETAHTVLGMLERVVGAEGTGRLAGLAHVRVAGKTGTAQILDTKTGSYSKTRYTAWFAGVAPADDPRIAIVVALDEPSGRFHTGGAVAAPVFARVAASQLADRGILTEPEPVPAAKVPRWVAIQERIDARSSLETNRKPTTHPARIAAKPVHPPPVPAAQQMKAPPIEPVLAAVSAGPPTRGALFGWETALGGSQPDRLRTVLVPNFCGESLNQAKRLAGREALDVRVHGSGQGPVIRQSPAAGTIIGGSDRMIILSFSISRGES